MTRKTIILLVLLIWVILACNAPGPISQSTATATVVATVTLLSSPTYSADMSPTAIPPTLAYTATAPAAGVPHFGPEILFATAPASSQATRSFPSGTTRIYAIWTYSGMAQEMLVRREWYLNGALWLEREEAWNASKYGANGTISDISIYDLKSGLPDGHYEVRLYIDGRPQFSDADAGLRSFDIVAPGGAKQQMTSPDGKLTVAVEPVNRIQLRDSSGQWRTLVEAHWVDGIDWFPNSGYIVYSDRIDDQSGSPLGVKWELWIVHIASGTTYQIGQADERLHLPEVSPDGHYIAVMQGTGWADACFSDHQPAIVALDAAVVKRKALYTPDDFSGLPAASEDSFLYPYRTRDYPLPGVWRNTTQLAVALSWTCVVPSHNGVYLFDLATMSASRIADLPAEG